MVWVSSRDVLYEVRVAEFADRLGKPSNACRQHAGSARAGSRSQIPAMVPAPAYGGLFHRRSSPRSTSGSAAPASGTTSLRSEPVRAGPAEREYYANVGQPRPRRGRGGRREQQQIAGDDRRTPRKKKKGALAAVSRGIDDCLPIIPPRHQPRHGDADRRRHQRAMTAARTDSRMAVHSAVEISDIRSSGLQKLETVFSRLSCALRAQEVR